MWIRTLTLGCVALVACAGTHPVAASQPWVPWNDPASLGWTDCEPGSTLVERHTPGDGGLPFELRRTRIGDPGIRAEVQTERLGPQGAQRPTCCRLAFPPGALGHEPDREELFLRRELFQAGGGKVEVEVVRRTTRLDSQCDTVPCPCMHDVLVEEVAYRRPGPAGEGAVRIRFDPSRSHFSRSQGCSSPPRGSAPDATGLVETRVAMALDVPFGLQGALHRCMRVRTWLSPDLPVEALECPSVLEGRAMWQTPDSSTKGARTLETTEVVSFDCKQSPPGAP
ncbi:hypothetical protein D7V97_12755 [Corallococcus sp. CA053C]|uniref:hypothetical protein n=1 Tax=Corallococcus sp. CA053C TaxID=2316732 RepID=UPI000EA3C5ED|nr:hypothetical protein [Corallococcus sp. CA053C]RKH10888.1 hypothetical protein D7V97_12755 [Corallococcus sp. CA053C]